MRNTSMFCVIVPVLRSTLIARNDFPSSVAVVSQIRSPRIAGEDQPFPGISVFHLMFLLSLQVRGSPLSVECPWPGGPRNSGQSSASTGREKRRRSRRPFIIADGDTPSRQYFESCAQLASVFRRMAVAPLFLKLQLDQSSTETHAGGKETPRCSLRAAATNQVESSVPVQGSSDRCESRLSALFETCHHK